jgi:GH15 family glucan-1,4-alpha-glucosidase
LKNVGDFSIVACEVASLVLCWSRSFHHEPDRISAADALSSIEAIWEEWAKPLKSAHPSSPEVRRSLVTLKGLAHWETGGIIAAATTSLPEKIGGKRNWDYRNCWLRDATFALYALIEAGFHDEARAWREWLVRAVAGSPADIQVMYGVAGERRLDEFEVPWLPGYENSAPVRIGNAAAGQLQLDIYGEVIGALYMFRRAGLPADTASWNLEVALIEHLEAIWQQPDDGIWEVRGDRRHFTHSKMMVWVAFDRAVRSAIEFNLEAPVERWSKVRDAIHDQVCELGFDPEKNSFVQAYGEKTLDASLLLMPIVGFLPSTDPRVKGTVAAIEKELLRDGLVLRYHTSQARDGLPPGEGAFLACSFWLADNYILQGRIDEARALYDRLVSYANDVGLLAEEYDPTEKRQLGNFPQAFSHLALIITAHRLAALPQKPADPHGAEGAVRPAKDKDRS